MDARVMRLARSAKMPSLRLSRNLLWILSGRNAGTLFQFELHHTGLCLEPGFDVEQSGFVHGAQDDAAALSLFGKLDQRLQQFACDAATAELTERVHVHDVRLFAAEVAA